MKLFEEKVRIGPKGSELSAVIHRCTSNKVAVLLPGYLDTKDYEHLRELAKVLAKEGITSVRFDPSGTWQSAGTIRKYSVSQYLKDVKRIIAFMYNKKQYEACILIGHSLGGRIALLYAPTDTRVTAIIPIMSPSTATSSPQLIKKWKENKQRISYRDLPNATGQKEFRVPYTMFQDSKKYSVKHALRTLTIPKLFIAGTIDKKIPAKIVKEMYNSARFPKEFVLLKGIDHDYRHSAKNIAIVNKNILRFLKRQV